VRGTNRLSKIECLLGLGRLKDITRSKTHLDTRGEHGVLLHEYGHYLQSLLLGPLYLPLIGLPSICWASIKKAGYFPAVPYHAFPTEWWAERLANPQQKNACANMKIDNTVCVCKVRPEGVL
ncbi:MAG: hypothetical protein KZQ72_10615, partial [Candidatus Thiodiazotropha sp. (ex Cardiolucina cf. quadrata)]|nr:hypothetical protein [Candidatus Thiodiazotropha sp. (ex Cardiolucina cf. quadrata)]